MVKQKQDKIIQKVWKRQGGKYGQKLVTVPASSKIKEGDYVEINLLEERLEREKHEVFKK